MSYNPENIFWDLFKSHSELEVDKIIDKYSDLFNDDNNWHPYGDDDENLSTFNSQQSDPMNALVEKITNSMDAMLLKGAQLHKINPEGDDVPESMKKAVEQLYDVPKGELSELTRTEMSDLAGKIQLIATGNGFKESLNVNELASLLIYDDGIGDRHENFLNSFLKIRGSNKSKIRFLQGKWNCGSTGAYAFCGVKRYQLIGSLKHDDKDKEFGFTLVRFRPYDNNNFSKTSYYEYFSPNGRVPYFKMNEDLDLGLYNRKFKSGSIVKMYSYSIPRGLRGDISTDFYRELNGLMYDTPLPFRAIDSRTKFPSNNIVIGNRNIFSRNKEKYIEDVYSGSIDVETCSIPYAIYILNDDAIEDPRQFMGTPSTFKSLQFLDNGQVHWFKKKTFFTSDLAMGGLKECTQVILDFSQVPHEIKNNVFQSNRTNIIKNKQFDDIMTQLKDSLKNDDVLIRKNKERKESLTRNAVGGDELITALMNDMPNDKNLMNLLDIDGDLFFKGSRTTNNRRNEREKIDLNLKRYPTIFELKEDKSGKSYRSIPINHEGRFIIKTDVENDYLVRTYDKGWLTVDTLKKRPVDNNSKSESQDEKTDIVTVSERLHNGEVKLTVKPTKRARVGEEASVLVRLSSPAAKNGSYFEVMFNVKIDLEISKTTRERSKPKTKDKFNIPGRVYAYKEVAKGEKGVRWDDRNLNWNEKDIVKMDLDSNESGDNIISTITINMDSSVFRDFIRKERNTNLIDTYTKKYWIGVYLNTLFLYSITQKMSNEEDSPLESDIDVNEYISELMKSYSNVLLYQNTLLTSFND